MQANDHNVPASVDRDTDKERSPTEAERRAEESFVRGLIARGEAARAVNGELPAGALFEIVEELPGQSPKVVRRRFSR